ncbi:fimbrial assembly protein [Superficieibacter electus]|uniref:Fimbrial assembly protein n=1 Tax=Superficieibacter electus TaxID=2022662 RepID=A0A2P5GW58_9ENTR|nr:fimbria/pilus periplasmic chaperone [Superficieibacter electus]POP47772.1 fimbrial assembly protein [Superficieibacter electus]POP50785.1 fimbrial assembly protein [Superficieibacter electus]
MKKIAALLLSVIMLPAQAGIVIYGTRVIYPAEKKEITVQLMNEGQEASLVQAWIDDGDTSLPPEKIQVPFMLTPPVARVAGGSGQQLKIKKMAHTLPTDRETLYFLNVLDIPPNNPENADKNVLKFAMQNRIKFIWRPAKIAPVTTQSLRQISLAKNGNSTTIKNDTANWITISEINAGGIKINEQSIMLTPLSSRAVTLKNTSARHYDITIIDDFGNYISDKVTVK